MLLKMLTVAIYNCSSELVNKQHLNQSLKWIHLCKVDSIVIFCSPFENIRLCQFILPIVNIIVAAVVFFLYIIDEI